MAPSDPRSPLVRPRIGLTSRFGGTNVVAGETQRLTSTDLPPRGLPQGKGERILGSVTGHLLSRGFWVGAEGACDIEDEVMTINKDLKQLVRVRMEKTGESYTTARLALLAKNTDAGGMSPKGWCPTCGKEVAYNTAVHPEDDDGDAEIEGSAFSASYERVLTCADCHEELRGVVLEFEEDVDIHATVARIPGCTDPSQHHWELDDTVAIATHGPIAKPPSGEPRYGVEVRVAVKCMRCKRELKFSAIEEEPLSSFDRLRE